MDIFDQLIHSDKKIVLMVPLQNSTIVPCPGNDLAVEGKQGHKGFEKFEFVDAHIRSSMVLSSMSA